MEIRILLVFFLINWSYNSISQENTPPGTYFVLKANTSSSDSKIEVADHGDTVMISNFAIYNNQNNSRQFAEKTYLGTPFFRNGWYKGVIQLKDGTVSNGTLAFDLIKNLVYYSLGTNSNAIESKPLTFTIDGTTLGKLDEKYTNSLPGYFELILRKPNLELFNQYSCIYRPKDIGERTGYDTKSEKYEGSFEKSSKLFLGWNNSVVELKTNKNIYKQFGKYREVLEKFGKENGLKYKKKQDILKLVAHFSTIME